MSSGDEVYQMVLPACLAGSGFFASDFLLAFARAPHVTRELQIGLTCIDQTEQALRTSVSVYVRVCIYVCNVIPRRSNRMAVVL